MNVTDKESTNRRAGRGHKGRWRRVDEVAPNLWLRGLIATGAASMVLISAMSACGGGMKLEKGSSQDNKPSTSQSASSQLARDGQSTGRAVAASASDIVDRHHESSAAEQSDAREPTSRAPGAFDERSAVRGRERAYRVAVVSDMNGSYGSTEYRDAVHSAVDWIANDLRPDLVVSTGDMVAGQRRGLDYSSMWAAFHRAVSDPLRSAGIPFAVTPGNHDASGYEVYAHEREVFVDEWIERRPDLDFVEDTFYPLHYAFMKGPALFISIDSTVIDEMTTAQRRWLEDVLTQYRDVPVKIVFGHVPLFAFAQGRETEVVEDPELLTLIEKHDVDLMVTGHHHAYYPGRHRDLRLLSMSCLGSGQRVLLGAARESQRSVAIIEYDDAGIRRVDALEAPSFQTTIARAELPPWLGGERPTVVRDDL